MQNVYKHALYTTKCYTSIKLSRPARQVGFLKARYRERMGIKTQEFSEKRGSGDQHHSKVKVLKLNPTQLYYTFQP